MAFGVAIEKDDVGPTVMPLFGWREIDHDVGPRFIGAIGIEAGHQAEGEGDPQAGVLVEKASGG